MPPRIHLFAAGLGVGCWALGVRFSIFPDFSLQPFLMGRVPSRGVPVLAEKPTMGQGWPATGKYQRAMGDFLSSGERIKGEGERPLSQTKLIGLELKHSPSPVSSPPGEDFHVPSVFENTRNGISPTRHRKIPTRHG
jgi:hypothetical protein